MDVGNEDSNNVKIWLYESAINFCYNSHHPHPCRHTQLDSLEPSNGRRSLAAWIPLSVESINPLSWWEWFLIGVSLVLMWCERCSYLGPPWNVSSWSIRSFHTLWPFTNLKLVTYWLFTIYIPWTTFQTTAILSEFIHHLFYIMSLCLHIPKAKISSLSRESTLLHS